MPCVEIVLLAVAAHRVVCRFLGNNKDKEEQIPYEDWLEREKPLVKALHAVKPQLSLVRTYAALTSACVVRGWTIAQCAHTISGHHSLQECTGSDRVAAQRARKLQRASGTHQLRLLPVITEIPRCVR
jgi:hypothetical protein